MLAFSTVYRRAFQSESSALTVHKRAWRKNKRAWSKNFSGTFGAGGPSRVLALGPGPPLDGPA